MFCGNSTARGDAQQHDMPAKQACQERGTVSTGRGKMKGRKMKHTYCNISEALKGQTKTAFCEVKKNADDIVPAIQIYPQLDLSHQALMTNEPGILWLRRSFQNN
jgi:hypothetical protein